ncbi:MAG: HAMP domain-containing histidine kinase [Ruminococcaceae bacterium]|nr:HAMP domain-containing histidine kinase [Oscillospiraceae bacterium]
MSYFVEREPGVSMDNKYKDISEIFDNTADSADIPEKNTMDYFDIINRQLREPVTNIFASLPLLADSINSQNTEKSMETLQTVYHKTYQMLKSVNNISLAARLIGKKEFITEIIDFSSMVQSVFETSQQVLPDYFSLDLQVENGCVVQGNSTLLTSMLFNLLLNSFDYRAEDDVKVCVSLKASNGRWIFSYKDNSLGIKPELSQQVFEPYFSCNPYNDGEVADKLGLGLYIAKQAILHAKGTMLLQTEFSDGVKIIASFAEYDGSACAIKSRPKDFMLNKYSAMFVTLCDYCILPDL